MVGPRGMMVAIAVCAVVAPVAGCGGSSSGVVSESDSSGTPASFALVQPALSSGSVRRLEPALRAVNTAERKVRGSKAYDVEDDRLRGERVWKVKVAVGTSRRYELDVRADGRKVLRERRRTRIDDDVRKRAQAKIPLAKALRIAAARAGGGTFAEAEIDRWRGRITWEATFERSGDREIEVRVDARSGKVVSVEVDD